MLYAALGLPPCVATELGDTECGRGLGVEVDESFRNETVANPTRRSATEKAESDGTDALMGLAWRGLRCAGPLSKEDLLELVEKRRRNLLPFFLQEPRKMEMGFMVNVVGRIECV